MPTFGVQVWRSICSHTPEACRTQGMTAAHLAGESVQLDPACYVAGKRALITVDQDEVAVMPSVPATFGSFKQRAPFTSGGAGVHGAFMIPLCCCLDRASVCSTALAPDAVFACVAALETGHLLSSIVAPPRPAVQCHGHLRAPHSRGNRPRYV